MNGDLISREALMDRFKEAYCHKNQCNPIGVWDLCEECHAYNAYRLIVSAEPAADAEPVRHARWIAQDDTFTRFMCSDCKAKNYDGSDNYCPNCGAKMDGDTT